MAFTLPLTLNGEQQSAAYVKAVVTGSDARITVVKLLVWTSQTSRTNGGEPVPSNWLPTDFSEQPQFTTISELQSNNPVDYAYKLLEQSGEFPEATWNI
jgi:hypothetical protein